MSLLGPRYDFYFISKLLLENGAEKEVLTFGCGMWLRYLRISLEMLCAFQVENADGCKAILGISGSKEGAEAVSVFVGFNVFTGPSRPGIHQRTS